MIHINLSKPKIKLKWARLWDNKIHLVFFTYRKWCNRYVPVWRARLATWAKEKTKEEKHPEEK